MPVMKFIISRDGIKRELATPFALCIDTEHFGRLIDAMKAAHAGMTATGTSYGWVRIDTDHPDPFGPPNTPPMKWTDVA